MAAHEAGEVTLVDEHRVEPELLHERPLAHEAWGREEGKSRHPGRTRSLLTEAGPRREAKGRPRDGLETSQPQLASP